MFAPWRRRAAPGAAASRRLPGLYLVELVLLCFCVFPPPQCLYTSMPIHLIHILVDLVFVWQLTLQLCLPAACCSHLSPSTGQQARLALCSFLPSRPQARSQQRWTAPRCHGGCRRRRRPARWVVQQVRTASKTKPQLRWECTRSRLCAHQRHPAPGSPVSSERRIGEQSHGRSFDT